jgi:Fusaric acid resistance protein-like
VDGDLRLRDRRARATAVTRAQPALALRRLRPRLLPIAQTATAAVAAYYIALVLPLEDDKPVFASIAAVISLGVSYQQRGRRAFELVGGVVVGLTVADLIVHAIGTGPLQIGLMIVLAMGTAVVLGGGELLISEAAVSALILASLPPTSGWSPDRFFEALIGGGVALVSAVLLFPPDPALQVGRALNTVFAELGRTLGDIARALEDGDAGAAERALTAARQLDDHIGGVRHELSEVSEATRFAPPRRGARGQVGRYERSLPQLDFAVRDTRVLARNSLRYLRGGSPAPPELVAAVAALGDAVWELAGSYDDEGREREVRRMALGAAGSVTDLAEEGRDMRLAEIVMQVRSLAVDLVRAADLAAGAVDEPPERPTDELLSA